MNAKTATPARRAVRRTEKREGDDRSAAPGIHVDLTSTDESSAPSMPHERDETVGMTDGVPSKRVHQAADDLKQGRQDTSRAPEADRAYDKLKR